MFITIEEGNYKICPFLEKNQGKSTEFLSISTYEEMEARANTWGISMKILDEARRFGYAKYDSFENFDCISLEMPDFEKVMISFGSVIIYLEKGRAFFFTSQKDRVLDVLEESAKSLGEKISLNRIIYLFFEAQTREDYQVFDSLEKEIMDLEQALITSQKHNCVSDIISLRKRLMFLKRYYEQYLNVLDILGENENGIFDGKTLRSFKMLNRRTERRFQSVLNLRDSVTQVRESYEAEVDISLNSTMKVFTVVTTIFLPLTLIVGWYGMNFTMPEYDWKYGYATVIVISVLFIIGGIYFFKKNKWF
ncbi:Cobalt/magnesium transport protein CorA [anaerobic digester metagenome]